MDESAISVRYAKALFSLAKDKDLLSAVKNDMELVSGACSQSVEFNLLLKSPVVKISEKIRLMKLIFGGKVNELSLNFLELITRKKREVFIPSICHNVLALIREHKNIKTAVLTTAIKMDPEVLQRAEKIFEKELGTKVELSGRVNPHIIGGIILRINDQQYDASVATQLKRLKQKMIKTQL
jgi:F-type H+-transporting ATPase subunit delta